MVRLNFDKLMSLMADYACRFYSFGCLSLIKVIPAKTFYLSGALRLSLVVFLLASCSGTKNEEGVHSQNLETFQSYQLSIDAERKSFSSIIESIEVVTLQETDNSLLTSASRVLKHRNEYLVINKSDEEVVFFDSEGKYLRTFRQLGQGPGEYQAINSIWIQDDELFIYERQRSIVFKYRIEGEFLDSKKLPFEVGHVIGYKDEYLVEFNYTIIEDSLMYKFGVLNSEMELTEKFLKTDEASDNIDMNPAPSMFSYSDGVLLTHMYSDSVYYYKQGQFKPFIHFDFGEDWYWENEEVFSEDKLVSSNKAWETDMSLSEKYAYVWTVVGYSHYDYFIIDRTTGKSERVDLRKDSHFSTTITDLGWEGDKWLVSMLPEDLLQLSEELNYKLPNLDQLSRSENPALVKVKFKDSGEW
ncbi:hypothetical protein AWW68_19155 [Roseivirga spongicola]|uniref:6-bladed beta-propeller n=1 Tax=Roseivirga spongicola TaxID=333140 RepID=A0A150XDU5_9BACT|nr:6-bladed beta-propeller [Roseivirga spongicola]KYG76897.1 hypothetical protein AWW68_19155 [Roseivirga spongicola]